MPENKLSFYDVQALLRATSAAEAKPSSPKPWLQLADVRSVLTAIDHDADEVYLVSKGRTFRIRYKGDKVWLSPSDGTFVPCGWFEPRTLRKSIDEAHVIVTL